MSKRYKLDDKYVTKKSIGKGAILVRVIHEEHYETPEYHAQQSKAVHTFFSKMAEDREELEKRHG